MSEITYINLSSHTYDCWVCNEEILDTENLFVWAYEDYIVPDESLQERGGQHVCARCYHIARSMTDDFTKVRFLHEVLSIATHPNIGSNAV